MKNMLKKEKAITLSALIVTIVILLILAGVTIATLTGDNGLYGRANQAKENYSISEAKEKLELAISDLMIEQTSRGENLTKDDLLKINSDEIDVKSIEKFPVEVICQSYKFSVDENFVVTYVEEANETIITYTTEPEGYTNKDEVKILVKISNAKGIKSIQKPGETDKILPQGQTEVGIDYKVTANGTYTFKIVDNENKETIKDITIEQIDKVEPKEFAPTIQDIKSTKFTIVAKTEDGEKTEISCKSGIEKYEFYVNGVKYESNTNSCVIKNLKRNTKYTVYAIAYDKASNSKKSSTIDVTTSDGGYPILTLNGIIPPEDGYASDSITEEAIDNNINTSMYMQNKVNKYINIDSNLVGRQIRISAYTNYLFGFYFIDSNGSNIKCDFKDSSGTYTNMDGYSTWYISQNYKNKLYTEAILTIPEGTKRLKVYGGGMVTFDQYIYEISLVE